MEKGLIIMIKTGGILAIVASVLFFNSCSNFVFENQDDADFHGNHIVFDSQYGSYLAGRIALSRRDFSTASAYYANVLSKNPDNPALLEQVYVILTAQGQISEAAEYARKAMDNGVNNNLLFTILAVDSVVKNDYASADAYIKQMNGEPYDSFLRPILLSWAYAGDGKQKEAFAEIEKIKNKDWLSSIYNMNLGMLNEYFGDDKKAEEFYEKIIAETPYELNFRYFRVIISFYMRTGQKAKAIALANRYKYEGIAENLQKSYAKKIITEENGKEKSPVNPRFATADAIVNGAAFMRAANLGSEIEYVFVSLAGFADENNAFFRIMQGEILENSSMYDEAVKIYETISPSSEEYYTAQIKIFRARMMQEKYAEAENLIRHLIKKYPNNTDLYFDLGESLRMSGNNKDALKYYKTLLEESPMVYAKNWGVYYALGIVSERENDWTNAEKYLRKALVLSNNNYMVENYLGYAMIDRDMNIDEAFSIISKAYEQASYDAHIIDSMGWAYYKKGDYKNAVQLLEKAANMKPGNALICDHLGDAYWYAGRKNEARFQWNHSLVLKEDASEVDYAKIREKIENGLPAKMIADKNRSTVVGNKE